MQGASPYKPVTLDSHLPRYDVNEFHSVEVAASPEAVLAATRALTPREVPVATALLALRRLPHLLRGRGGLARALDRPLLDQMADAGFNTLAETPDELVFGIVGRFWRLDSGVLRIAPEDYRGFDTPGFAKGAMDFRVAPLAGGRTRLTTETRVQSTSDAARRAFSRYWRVVGPGSAAIRRIWLGAIKRRAEKS